MIRISEVEKKAKGLGIKDTWRFSKKELIRTIQRNEGNFPCFGTARNSCNQTGCCWMSECLR